MSDTGLQIDPLRLPASLAARICHDIAGPLGALAGTLDLLAEDGDPEALALARETAAMLAARLRLVRAAWAEEVEVPGISAIRTLIAGLPNADRLQVTLSLDPGMTSPLRRLGLNLLLLASASLPRGGSAWLDGDGASLRLRIEGRDAGWPKALAICAATPEMAREWLHPRELAAPMACLLAQARGLRIDLVSDTELLATAR